MELELQTRRNENKLTSYRPYPKQAEFHAAGVGFRERLLMAGNQLGKTWSASYETAMHLTGRYPDWWQGRVFDHPIVSWAAGVTSEGTRDTVQRLLLGRPEQLGTGAIPKSAIKGKPSAKRGVADAVDTVVVRFGGGGDVQAGESSLTFKSYDQGREKFQGETLNLVWLDEEPGIDIYTESLTRTNATGGMVMLTFTPLLGMSEVVTRFLIDKVPGTHVTTMTIDDVDHYTPEQRIAIINSYPAHEREARTKGVPIMGSGRVFPIEESLIRWEAASLPGMVKIVGMDFGWDHPTAAVWLTWDRDSDVVYVTDTYRVSEQTPLIHSAAIKARGDWIPVAWPHDGLQHDKGSGEQLAEMYRKHGLKMLPERATFPDGSNGLEAGVAEMMERMQTGRLRVASHLTDWFEEFRLYHRKDGLIVKVRDDLMSATRYGLMMLRFARSKPTNQVRSNKINVGDNRAGY
jgi:phage terminase large subunit-like protein